VTRLSEALERARNSGDAVAATAVATPGVDSPTPGGQLPQAWDLDSAAAEGMTDVVAAARELVEGAEPGPQSSPADFPYPFTDPAVLDKLVVGVNPDSTLVEQYRRLAAALHNAQLRTHARTVMIASAVESEGKTLTATNLALTLSHSYQRRVLLVDADLRRPSIHQLFQLSNRVGLGDTLKQVPVDRHLPVQKISPTLWVMTAGRPDSDPMSVLISETMKQFLIDAADQFDWVVVDTPPVALLPDAKLLAEMIDSALLVVRANSTPYPLVTRAIEAIGTQRILGVVLNRAERSQVAVGYGYYSYSYTHSPSSERRRRFPFGRRRKA